MSIDGNGTKQFYFGDEQVAHLRRNGPERKWWEMKSAVDVLKAPNAIFEGLLRENHDNSLCYVGMPKEYGPFMEQEPATGIVFLVFVTCDGLVFEWRWEAEDPDCRGMPLNAKSRFKTLKWKC